MKTFALILVLAPFFAQAHSVQPFASPTVLRVVVTNADGRGQQFRALLVRSVNDDRVRPSLVVEHLSYGSGGPAKIVEQIVFAPQDLPEGLNGEAENLRWSDDGSAFDFEVSGPVNHSCSFTLPEEPLSSNSHLKQADLHCQIKKAAAQ